jgi:phosphoribosylcarboxyaminoimidazole (NCAIR) mutase
VIGVPLTSRGVRAGGLDSLLTGGGATGTEPVAWVALDDATGAAVLTARILAA